MDKNKLQNKKLKAFKEGNQNSIAALSLELAEINTTEGQYEDAIKDYEDALLAYKALGKEMDYGRVHRMIGEIYCSYLGDINKALEHQNIYLRIARKEDDLLERQRAHATLGRTYFCGATSDVDNIDKNLLAEAQKAYMKSVVICEELKEPLVTKIDKLDMRARLLLNLANVFEYKGEFTKAIDYLEKAIALCNKNDLIQSLQQSYYTLALVYSHKNDFQNTLLYLNKAYDAASRLSSDRIAKQCQILLTKGEILATTGDYKSAKQILVEAFKLKHPNLNERKVIEKTLKIIASLYYTEESLIGIADNEYGRKNKLYETMGDACCELKLYTKAIEYYKKMLENAQLNNETGKGLSAAYISLAQTYKDNKEYDLALEYFKKDLNLSCNNPQEVVESYLNITEVLELSKVAYEKIEPYFNKAIETAHDANLIKLEEKCYTKLLILQRKSGKNDLVEVTLQKRQALGVDASSDNDSDEVEGNPVIENSIQLGDISGLSEDSEAEENASKIVNRSRRSNKFRIRKNKNGETPLHVACIKGNIKNVELLLNQGHPVNTRDNCGWTPLHEACNHGFLNIVKLLIDSGADINDRGGTECEGTTPLHDACGNGRLEVIELLLDQGASPLVKNDHNQTPLDILCKSRSYLEYDECQNIFLDTLIDRMSKILKKAGKLEKNTMALIHDQNFETPSTSRNEQYLYTPTKSPLSKRNETPSKSPYSKRYETRLTQSPNVSKLNSDDEDDNNELHQNSATQEYREAINNLRRKPTMSPQRYKRTPPSKQTAYINPGDVDDDNWLENDMPNEPSSKRRRINNSFELDAPSSSRTPKRTSKSPAKSKKRITPIKRNINMEIESQDQIVSYENDFHEQNEIIENNSNSHLNRNILRRKSQTTLLSAGFSRKRSSTEVVRSASIESDFGEVNATSSRLTQPDSTTVPLSSSTQLVSNIISIDIHIENKIWKIPIPRRNVPHLTISWLAEEAAKRYYNKEAVKPTLQLETKDRAILDNNDPLEMIITCNELFTTITSWNLPSIVERYLDGCKIYKTVVDFHLKKCLDSCQATLILDLSNVNLSDNQIVPALKALKHQRTLEQINISGNLFTDDTIKIFCEVLQTLTSLQTLDISNNLISWESINYISEIFTNNTINLRELNFSYNNIGDNIFLNSLNPCILKEIHLSGVADLSATSYITTELIAFLRLGTPFHLEYIDLSRCHVNNYDLTGFSLQMILTSKVSVENVILENCKNICVGLSLDINNIESIQKSIKCLKINIVDESIFDLIKHIWKSVWNDNTIIRRGNDNYVEFAVKK
ncbi:tonsoku-like protein [Chrysoperla carnea]|uniref:tonsoku-like protein n=1 Tax=Chrysoperla carnea TaxID=189513 RepID=UPI001D07E20A|nr:tonsoku-like protein [Chrysoperla carnea]